MEGWEGDWAWRKAGGPAGSQLAICDLALEVTNVAILCFSPVCQILFLGVSHQRCFVFEHRRKFMEFSSLRHLPLKRENAKSFAKCSLKKICCPTVNSDRCLIYVFSPFTVWHHSRPHAECGSLRVPLGLLHCSIRINSKIIGQRTGIHYSLISQC